MDSPQPHKDSRAAHHNVSMLCMYGLKFMLLRYGVFARNCSICWKDIETNFFFYTLSILADREIVLYNVIKATRKLTCVFYNLTPY